MTDTPTPEYGLREQELGTNTNTWGDTKLNEALVAIGQILGKTKDIAITGDYTLTNTPYVTTADTRNFALRFTGTLSAVATVTLPNSGAKYLVINESGKTLTFETSAGAGVDVPDSRVALIHCDAVDVLSAVPNFQPTPITLTNTGDLPTYGQVATLIANATTITSPGQVRNSAADTTAGFLSTKLTVTSASGELTIATVNPAADETSNLTYVRNAGQIALYDSIFCI